MGKSTSLFKIFQQFPDLKPSLSAQYHRKTKIEKYLPKTPKKEWPKAWTKVFYKGYPRFPAFTLPKPSNLKKTLLKDAFVLRESERNFSNEPLEKQVLGDILYYSAGERKIGNKKRRFYPSAGARYPLEVYPLVLNVNDLPNGVYHYYVRKHALELLWEKKISRNYLKKNLSEQGWLAQSAVLLVISAIFWRNQIKYGERGYRYILVDLGHLCQNVYLASAAWGVGCCSVGGFIDDGFNKLLDLDGWRESAIIVIALGNQAK